MVLSGKGEQLVNLLPSRVTSQSTSEGASLYHMALAAASDNV